MKKHITRIAFSVLVAASLGIADATAQCRTCPMTGPTTGLINQTLTYTTPGQTGAQFFWSVTGNLRILGAPSATSIQIRNSAPASGKVCVSKSISGGEPCTNCRSVSIGNCVPPSRITVSQVSGECEFDIFLFRARLDRPAVGTYRWTALSGRILGSTTGSQVQAITNGRGGINVQATFTANCNNTRLTGSRRALFRIDCGEPPIQPLLFPNPSGEQLSIALGTEGANYVAAYEVLVYDGQGNPIMREMMGAGTQTLDIRHLPKGEYYAKIMQQGKTIDTQRFIKE